jgi:death on curing protein
MDRGAHATERTVMKYVSHFDVLQIRTRLQAAAGKPFDLLNPSALQSALAAPRQAVFGEEVHEGVLAKAAILFTRLINNHPFVDGNKRIAVEALRLFLKRNYPAVRLADDELIDWANRIAQNTADEEGARAWLESQLPRQ